jgi:hypothetical protein
MSIISTFASASTTITVPEASAASHWSNKIAGLWFFWNQLLRWRFTDEDPLPSWGTLLRAICSAKKPLAHPAVKKNWCIPSFAIDNDACCADCQVVQLTMWVLPVRLLRHWLHECVRSNTCWSRMQHPARHLGPLSFHYLVVAVIEI